MSEGVLQRLKREAREAEDEAAAALVPRPAIGNPLQCAPTIDPDAFERRHRCLTHRDCVDYADKVKWKNFTCSGCSVRNEYHPESFQGRLDHEGSANLVLELFPEHVRRREFERDGVLPTRAEMKDVIVPGRLWTRQGKRRGAA